MTRPLQALRFWCAVAMLGGATACHHAEPYEKPLTPVLVGEVRRQAVERPLRYSAAIEPQTRLDLAFRVGGYVTSLAAVGGRTLEDGDRVTAGMVLATVRQQDYDEKIAQAQSQLAEATAARTAAEQAVERARALYASRSLTKPDLDQAVATLASIDAKMSGARGLVAEAQLAKGDASLKTPMGGVILKKLVEVGSLVGPGTPGFVIADTRSVKVVIGVPDTMLGRFPLGAVEVVQTEAQPDRRYEGRVTSISPTADLKSRLFEVQLTLGNADGALKPGMVATVDVSDTRAAGAAPEEALAVPLSAIVRSPGGAAGYAVFVVDSRDGASTAHRRTVTLGQLLGNEIVVASGLTGGEQVILQGASIVADGERVNPTR